MKSTISKSVPNPAVPKEVFKHYFEHFIRWLHIAYQDQWRDPFGTKRKQQFSALLKLKDSGKNRTAFVLASGPSINLLDPAKVQKFCRENQTDIYCVNYFVSSEFAQKSGVDYWLLSDPRHFDLTIPDTQKAFQHAAQLVRKGVLVSEFHLNKAVGNINKPLIAFNDKETSGIFSQNINPCYPRSYLTMSAYKALAVAIYAGYDKIYICGFDNTYVRDLGCDKDNKLYRNVRHFTSNTDANYVSARDYKMGLGTTEVPRGRTVSEEMLAYSRLFGDLRKFKRYNIINLDCESLTDAFKKDDSLDIYIDSYIRNF